MVTFQHNMKRGNAGSWGNSSFIWIPQWHLQDPSWSGPYFLSTSLPAMILLSPSSQNTENFKLSQEITFFFTPGISHDFLSHITNSHALPTKYQTALIWKGHSHFLFMLLLFCEYIPSCNYIFMSPKYKPREHRKLICFVHYSVLRT